MIELGRNEPCHCGSGKKYKKCCLEKDARAKSLELRAHLELQLNANQGEISESFFPESSSTAGDALFEDAVEVAHEDPGPDRYELPPDDVARVFDWEREIFERVEDDEPESALAIVNLVLDEHPRLFRYLNPGATWMAELHEALLGAGRHPACFELIQRIKREQPEAFAYAHLGLDRTAIAELLMSGRRSEVPGWLARFCAGPAEDPEALADVIELLLTTGCDTELYAFAKLAGPALQSAEVVHDPQFLVEWIVFEQLQPLLDAGEVSDAAIVEVEKRCRKQQIDFQRGFIRQELEEALGPFPDPAPLAKHFKPGDRRKGEKARFEYLRAIQRHFMTWLHRRVGTCWASSRYYSSLATGLLLRRPAESLFGFDAKKLREHIDEEYFIGDEGEIIGVKSLSLLQALWWFGPYLEENRVIDVVGVGELHALVRNERLALLERFPPTDAGARILPDPAAFRWVSR